MKKKPVLYTYFRSSSAYRVRIVLHYKQIDFESYPVHLLKNEQLTPKYTQKNPLGQVPFFEDNHISLSQSMTIIEYIDTAFPGPKVLPGDLADRMLVKQMCEIINSGIQPLHNLSTGQKLSKDFHASKLDIKKWNAYWISKGLHSIEALVKAHAGQYAFSDQITAADAFLIPQVYSAHRYDVDMSDLQCINHIVENCNKLESFQRAHPDQQK